MAIRITPTATLADPVNLKARCTTEPLHCCSGRTLDRFSFHRDCHWHAVRLVSSECFRASFSDCAFPVDLAVDFMTLRRKFRKRRITNVRRPSKSVFRPRGFLLTRNEAAFFRILMAVIPNHYQVSCKVRLADLITCSESNWQRGCANRIAQKHVDFVVTDIRSSRIVSAIELDDLTHRRRDRRLRDAFVNGLFREMGIPLIRVPASWRYDADLVRRQLGSIWLIRSQ
jgi:hypothetical protein